MNPYTRKQLVDALQKLPEPLATFLDSKTLSNLFAGIETKHALSTPETAVLAGLVSATLTGLESETALETNLHQLMPELSNAATRELAADISDRIFKEAQRRVAENVIDQSTMTLRTRGEPASEEELKRNADVERIDNLPDDSPELVAIAEQEQAEEAARLKLAAEEEARLEQTEAPEQETQPAEDPDPDAVLAWMEKNPDASIEDAPFYKNAVTNPEEELAREERLKQEKTTPAAPSVKIAQSTAIRNAEETLKAPAAGKVDGIRSVSIAQSKLQTPTAAAPVETQAAKPLSESPAPRAANVPDALRTPPPAPKRVDGIDPYREPFE